MPVDYNHPNMRIWRDAEPTDPKFVKPITGKQYKGNSPHPHWVKQRLTEAFGPAGHGWGVVILDQQFLPIGQKTMHYVTIELWYMLDGVRGAIQECGGTELGGIRKSSGEAYADEDAPKKSVTDALVKAASAIGFCADIFLGRWDDSKYVADRQDAEEKGGRALTAAQQAEAVKLQEELRAQVRALVDSIGNVTVQEAFASCRAEAMDLRTKLTQHGMRPELEVLGAAVKAAALRFTTGGQKAA